MKLIIFLNDISSANNSTLKATVAPLTSRLTGSYMTRLWVPIQQLDLCWAGSSVPNQRWTMQLLAPAQMHRPTKYVFQQTVFLYTRIYRYHLPNLPFTPIMPNLQWMTTSNLWLRIHAVAPMRQRRFEIVATAWSSWGHVGTMWLGRNTVGHLAAWL